MCLFLFRLQLHFSFHGHGKLFSGGRKGGTAMIFDDLLVKLPIDERENTTNARLERSLFLCIQLLLLLLFYFTDSKIVSKIIEIVKCEFQISIDKLHKASDETKRERNIECIQVVNDEVNWKMNRFAVHQNIFLSTIRKLT